MVKDLGLQSTTLMACYSVPSLCAEIDQPTRVPRTMVVHKIRTSQ